ncbi:MAG: MoaD/ThiS family protein [Egibacteraceae bacterium]
MATTIVRLPQVLEPAVGAVRQVTVSGVTVQEALADLCAQHPTLRIRLFDEDGRLRRHVLCVHNGRATRLREPEPLADGDELAILPAVSGG